MYEYICDCGDGEEVFRSVAHRDEPMFCRSCRNPMRRDLSVPHVKMVERPHAFWRRDRDTGQGSSAAVHVWDSERKFPNLRNEGDGAMTFRSKTEYKAYLNANNIQELSTEAKLEKPRGVVTVAK